MEQLQNAEARKEYTKLKSEMLAMHHSHVSLSLSLLSPSIPPSLSPSLALSLSPSLLLTPVRSLDCSRARARSLYLACSLALSLELASS